MRHLKGSRLGSGLILALLLFPIFSWADNIVVPSNDPTIWNSPKKTASKNHNRKHPAKKRRKNVVKMEQGNGAPQEEVTTQREVSQGSKPSDKRSSLKKLK